MRIFAPRRAFTATKSNHNLLVSLATFVQAVSSGTNPIIVGVALAIATSMAFWLVIGTPASSVVYSAGLLDAKDFIRMATFAWPAALVIIIVMIIFYWVGLGIQPIMIEV